jgi:hypothetical protein
MGRPKKVVAVPVEEPPPPSVVIETVPASSVESLFDDFPDDDEPEAALAVRDILALDSDLTPDEKKLFVDLLNEHMPIKQRAIQLTKLAMFTDQKRAGVGLRALEEINKITGMSGDKPTLAPSMFALPEGTSVSVTVQKVVK